MPHLAVAGGKNTPTLLLNRDSLGGHGNTQLGSAPGDSCWCGPSYFTGVDGLGRVVTSTGQSVTVYTMQTSPNAALANPVSTQSLATGQDGGFFTSVSSNGTTAGSAVVWAVSRPVDTDPATVSLYAFDPMSGALLYVAPAGTWPNSNANANLVPTVANGRVYVGSYQQLAIFGVGTPKRKAVLLRPAAPALVPLAGAPHMLTGRVTEVNSTGFTLRLRDGRVQAVAFGAGERAAWLRAGAAARVRGDFAKSAFAAVNLLRAKGSSALWEKDR